MKSYKNKRFKFYDEVPFSIRMHFYGLTIMPLPKDLTELKLFEAQLAYWDRNLPIKMRTNADLEQSSPESRMMNMVLTVSGREKQIRRPLGHRPKGDLFRAKGGRPTFWMMYPQEIRSCCIGLTTPKYNKPIPSGGLGPNYDLLRHCFSIRHIANVYDASYKDLYNKVSAFFIEDGKCVQCGADYVARNDYLCLACK